MSSAAEARALFLESALKSQQFYHDAVEVDSWLADKEAALASAHVGNDKHRATQLLQRHKVSQLQCVIKRLLEAINNPIFNLCIILIIYKYL